MTTLHNRNEFRTNAAVRNFVSRLHNCQTFWVSHRRTGAQAHKQHTVLALFWQNWSINRPGNLPPPFCFYPSLFRIKNCCAAVRLCEGSKHQENTGVLYKKIAQTLLCAAQLKSHNRWLWSLLPHSCAALPGLHGLPRRKG